MSTDRCRRRDRLHAGPPFAYGVDALACWYGPTDRPLAVENARASPLPALRRSPRSSSTADGPEAAAYSIGHRGVSRGSQCR